MKKLTVQLCRSPGNNISVGQLAEIDRNIYFEYNSDFLNGKLQLSPFKLPLKPGLIQHEDRAFGPLPGLFDDSLPDGWGLLLMDRLFRQRGIDPAIVSPLDRLAYLGNRTMGALTYHPQEKVDHDEHVIDLHQLGKSAQQVLSGEAVDILSELMRAGGSPGGARPKVLVGVKGKTILSGENDLPAGFGHWMVKFSTKAESRDAGPLEYAYSEMARAAGIEMPETRLFQVSKDQSYFGVRRFDRDAGNKRIHVHTFGNLIHTRFRIPSTDYADLLNVTRMLTRNHADVLRVFRQMVFNVTAHNRDDHAKNFGFVMNNAGEWSLSPAYDLVFSPGPGGEHTMTIAGEGRAPTRAHILQLAKQFDIKPSDSTSIIEDVNNAIAKWAMFANKAGCTNAAARLVDSKHLTI